MMGRAVEYGLAVESIWALADISPVKRTRGLALRPVMLKYHREDADSRVVMLKQRMEALKKKRAAKAASAVSGGTGVGKAK